MPTMYELFQTDKDLEKQGVVVDYGTFRVTLSRAGGFNKRYNPVLNAKARPFKRAIDSDSLDPDVGDRLVHETFIDSVIKNWEVKDEEGNWHVGIESSEEGGSLLPFNRENLLLTFTNLPDLFLDIQEQASKATIYRSHLVDTDSGN